MSYYMRLFILVLSAFFLAIPLIDAQHLKKKDCHDIKQKQKDAQKGFDLLKTDNTYKFYWIKADSFYVFQYCIDLGKVNHDDSLLELYREDTIIINEQSFCMDTLLYKIAESIHGVSLERKIDFLLTFVQSIPHVNDITIFGEEKILTPESFLLKQKGDCDDKVILFAFLIKKILNIECIWLEYPGEQHVNCGISVSPKANQFSVQYNNKTYVVAEPSGLFYPLGEGFIDVNVVDKIIKPIAVKE